MPIQVIPHDNSAWENIMNSFSRAGNAWGDKYQSEQKQKNLVEALKKQGIDPSAANLSKEERALLFKSKFPTEKPLNDLQKSQKELADERTKLIKKKNEFLTGNELFGDDQEEINKVENESENAIPFLDEIQKDLLKSYEKPEKNKKNSKKNQTNGLIPEKEIYKTAVNFPTVATHMQKYNETILADQKHKEDLEFKKSKAGQEHDWKIHQESQKYDEELENNARIAKRQMSAVEEIKKSIESGNVKPSSWTNILKGFGTIGDKIANAIQNKDEATLLSSIPQLLEGWKQVFGVRLSDADLKILEDKLPSIGKSPEANKAILRILDKYSGQTLLREKIARDIKSKNKGLRPLGFSNMVETRFDEMMMPVKIKNPHTGNIVEIPAYQIGDYIEDGGIIINGEENEQG